MEETFGFLIFNASSGSAHKLAPADILAELPEGTRFHEFVEDDDPVALTRQAVGAGARWVAVAGGDGTVEAVAGALVDTGVPLGVIACGTYNNFARSADIPADPLEAARWIRAGVTRQMDVGFVNQRPFFECVGIGLDAAIFPLSEEIKSGGFWKWIDLFRRAIKYPRQTFEIELDRPLREALSRATPGSSPARRWQKWLKSNRHHRARLRALMITVSNGPYYGMNFAVAPDARIDDGHLTITIFKRYSKLELWWHYLSISSGRRIYAPRLVTLTATRIRVSGPRQLAVHLDGSTLDDWPVEISVVANRLLIFGDPNPKK